LTLSVLPGRRTATIDVQRRHAVMPVVGLIVAGKTPPAASCSSTTVLLHPAQLGEGVAVVLGDGPVTPPPSPLVARSAASHPPARGPVSRTDTSLAHAHPRAISALDQGARARV
jgi:hypothetical protein